MVQVPWLILVRDMTQSSVWCDSFWCVTWLMHWCDKGVFQAWYLDCLKGRVGVCCSVLQCVAVCCLKEPWSSCHEWFPRVTGQFYAWHNSVLYLTWLRLWCDMGEFKARHLVYLYGPWCRSQDWSLGAIWLIPTCDVTHCHVMGLVHLCDGSVCKGQYLDCKAQYLDYI